MEVSPLDLGISTSVGCLPTWGISFTHKYPDGMERYQSPILRIILAAATAALMVVLRQQTATTSLLANSAYLFVTL